MSGKTPDPNELHTSSQEDMGLELFRKVQQDDPDKARMYNAIAVASIDASYPEMSAVLKSALKWNFLAGMVIGEYLTTARLNDSDLQKFFDSQPPGTPQEAA